MSSKARRKRNNNDDDDELIEIEIKYLKEKLRKNYLKQIKIMYDIDKLSNKIHKKKR